MSIMNIRNIRVFISAIQLVSCPDMGNIVSAAPRLSLTAYNISRIVEIKSS